MKNKLIIGRYLPLQSIVHQLDPRAKLIFVFFFIILIFFCHSLGTVSYTHLTLPTICSVLWKGFIYH